MDGSRVMMEKLKLTIICKWGERWCNINATFHRADAMKWNIASSHGALPQTSFAYYGVFQFFHHNSGTIYVILCCDMSNINLHLVVKWNFWWHLESCTTNRFWDSISCHLHIMVSFGFSIITQEPSMSSYIATCLTSTYI